MHKFAAGRHSGNDLKRSELGAEVLPSESRAICRAGIRNRKRLHEGNRRLDPPACAGLRRRGPSIAIAAYAERVADHERAGPGCPRAALWVASRRRQHHHYVLEPLLESSAAMKIAVSDHCGSLFVRGLRAAVAWDKLEYPNSGVYRAASPATMLYWAHAGRSVPLNQRASYRRLFISDF
jgi:hypothetical protein